MKYKEINVLITELNKVIGKQETKIQKKLFKFAEKIKSYQEDYLKKVEELRLDNAAADEKGVLLTNEKGEFRFSKEGLKKLNEDIKALNDKDFDFKKIEVVNPQGLEDFHFLEDWTTGITFNPKEVEEEL
jgi:hypothetical protein